ncbi:hypothetical protein OG989_31505 [Micromonospora sp. NBC_01740]|nr:hypothetical protein OG989_31505 [Micromonospora sp. NBC_01740]
MTSDRTAAPVTHPDRRPALGAGVTSPNAAPVTHPDRRRALGRA